MKKIVFYFDHKVKKILVEKETEEGEKQRVLSSHYNFVYTAEIVARSIEFDDPADIPQKLDSGYTYYNRYIAFYNCYSYVYLWSWSICKIECTTSAFSPTRFAQGLSCVNGHDLKYFNIFWHGHRTRFAEE